MLVALVLAMTGVPLLTGPTAMATGSAVPQGFRDTTVLTHLASPTAIRFAPNGKIFVAQKSGIVLIYDSLADSAGHTLVDLSTEVYDNWDRGLTGLAVDPAFPARPYVYLLFSRDADIGGVAPRWGKPGVLVDPCPTPPGPTDQGCVISGRLLRLTVQDDHVTGSKVLLDGWCQQFPSHTVGDLQFGPTGALYVSGGEGASFNYVDKGQTGNPCGDPVDEGGALRAQDLRTTGDPVGFSGTVLRVDPDTGAAAAGNPLAGNADPGAQRIVADGLRNPFRMTVRPGTDEVYTTDVGWNTWEELDALRPGALTDFGWPCYEGTDKQPGYAGAAPGVCTDLYTAGPAAVTPPLLSWAHQGDTVPGDGCRAGNSAAATGIAFYPGTGGEYPAQYQGAMFFADYARSCIWWMRAGADGRPDPSTKALFASATPGPVSLVTGPSGDLFYVSLTTGTVHRIRYFAGNQPPDAAFTATPAGGLKLTFDGSASTDPNSGDTLHYAWDLDGDGQFDDATGVTATYTYPSAGTRTVRLQVTDTLGATDVATQTIAVGSPAPVPVIQTPTVGTGVPIGQTVTFSGTATSASGAALPASALSWTGTIVHCSTATACHRHQDVFTGNGFTGSFVMPDHEPQAHVELALTATDHGQATTVLRTVDYQTAQVTVNTLPAGAPVTVSGQDIGSPGTSTEYVGARISLSVPPTAIIGGVAYDFVSWSDGGARAHEVTVPAGSSTFTATYRARAGSVLFADGFTDSDAPSWSPADGRWRVCDGPDGDSSAYCQRGYRDGVSVAGSTQWTDYTVQAAVDPVRDRGHAGLLARVSDDEHYYELSIRRSGDSDDAGEWVLSVRGSDDSTELASGSYQLGDDYTYLRLQVAGNRLVAFAGPAAGGPFQQLGSVTDGTYPRGQIGLGTHRTPAEFADVKVTTP